MPQGQSINCGLGSDRGHRHALEFGERPCSHFTPNRSLRPPFTNNRRNSKAAQLSSIPRKSVLPSIDLPLPIPSCLSANLTYVDFPVVSEGVSVRRQLRRAPPRREQHQRRGESQQRCRRRHSALHLSRHFSGALFCKSTLTIDRSPCFDSHTLKLDLH